MERELLETEAQENEAARKKQLTEVTKTVFHIYFRLLKTAPRSRLLAAALNGLAKLVNLDHSYSSLTTLSFIHTVVQSIVISRHMSCVL